MMAQSCTSPPRRSRRERAEASPVSAAIKGHIRPILEKRRARSIAQPLPQHHIAVLWDRPRRNTRLDAQARGSTAEHHSLMVPPAPRNPFFGWVFPRSGAAVGHARSTRRPRLQGNDRAGNADEVKNLFAARRGD